MPLKQHLKKVLVVGSGPIVIGQAAEFDYAGTQACRALREEGLNVVLVNSNPATIMTDGAIADEVYVEPLTLPSLREIIRREKPDGLLSTLGGQTGLTLSMQLAREGFLEEQGVELLGARLETIEKRKTANSSRKQWNPSVSLSFPPAWSQTHRRLLNSPTSSAILSLYVPLSRSAEREAGLRRT